MRSLSTKLVAAALVMALAMTAFAQRQGGGRGGPGFGPPEGAMLLLNKSVQDELKLSDDQKASLTKIQAKQREAMTKAREDAGGDFAKMREAMQATMQASQKEATKVLDTLKPEQKKRLHQIEAQLLGTRALTRPHVQKDLELTDKQKEELKGINDDLAKDRAEIMKDAGQDREARQAAFQKVQKIQQEASAKALKVLTAEQQTKFKELQGEKFTFVPDQGGPGGRGRGKNKNKQQDK
jgi:Spy/CpxP family protein refolding chaperone